MRGPPGPPWSPGAISARRDAPWARPGPRPYTSPGRHSRRNKAGQEARAPGPRTRAANRAPRTERRAPGPRTRAANRAPRIRAAHSGRERGAAWPAPQTLRGRLGAATGRKVRGSPAYPGAPVFTSPLGLLALVAVPVVLALHLLRRRSRPLAVSALELWADLAAPPAAGRRFEKLQRSASLWLELLAAALFALAVAGPKACGGAPEVHSIWVLDSHAALLAENASAESVHTRLREALTERLAAMGPRDTVTLVESLPAGVGVGARVLGTPAQGRADGRVSLDLWQPGHRAHDLAPAVELARQLASARVPGERIDLWLATDRFEPATWPEDLGLLAEGEPRDNVGIVRAWRGRDADGAEWLEVECFHGGAAEREVEIELVRDPAEGPRIARLTLPPGGSARASLALPAPANGEARTWRIARRGAGDALAADDLVYLAPEHQSELHLDAEADPSLRAALGLGANLEHWLALAAPARLAEPGAAHLYLGSGRTPASRTTWSARLAPAGDGQRPLTGPFLLERAHPLLEGLDLGSALWVASDAGARGTTLVSDGNQRLLGVIDLGARVELDFDLDVRRSPWLASADWPLLLSNWAAWRRAELPRPTSVNLHPGEAAVVPDARAGRWRLSSSDGSSEELQLDADGALVLPTPRRAAALALERDGEPFANLATGLFDRRSSDLSGARRGLREPKAPADGTQRAEAPRHWRPLLLVLALLCLAADWFVLAMRPRTGKAER
ncbi:MAG: hypothetical protein GC161_08285 [Planctomycetaceae bacterium]|nr:hypothetical protein [Planctomycetaceae bacterium]